MEFRFHYQIPKCTLYIERIMKSRNDGLREEGKKKKSLPSVVSVDFDHFRIFFSYQTRKFDTKREGITINKLEETLA